MTQSVAPRTASPHARLLRRIDNLRERLSQTTDIALRRALMVEILNLETRWALALHPVR